MATQIGTAAANLLIGTDEEADILFGQGGADTLRGGAGQDTLAGGTGDDVIEGGLGADRMSGGAGNDTFRFTTLAEVNGDHIGDARPGDRLDFGFATAGWTFIGAGPFSGGGQEIRTVLETLEGGTRALRVDFGSASLTLAGNLHLVEQAPGIFGVALNRVIAGTDRADTLTGAGGTDTLRGLGGSDLLVGGAADEVIFGDAGHDTLSGGAGADRLDGGEGNDLLVGGTGDDALMGGAGADTLFGDDGADRLAGGDGNDRLVSSAGPDTLEGGAGNDLFVFSSVLGFSDILSFDGGWIVDLAAGDRIDLSALEGFRYIGDAAFSGDAGEIRLLGVSLQIDSDGDSIADRALNVGGAYDGLTETTRGSLILKIATPVMLPGTPSADTLIGGGGRDTLRGEAGNDVLRGGAGNDELAGGDGADVLRAEGGRNLLAGGAGRDVLFGSLRDDMNGGTGADRYVITALEQPAYGDALSMLELDGTDLLDLSSIAGLRFIGSAAYSFIPGEVRTENEGLRFDLDGDGQTDRGIRISSTFAYGGWPPPTPTLTETTPGSLVLQLAAATRNGTAGADTITGDSYTAILRGLDGDDVILGRHGDTIFGGAGSDRFDIDDYTTGRTTLADIEAGETVFVQLNREAWGGINETLPLVFTGDSGPTGQPYEARILRDAWVNDVYYLTALAIDGTGDGTPDRFINLAGFNGTLTNLATAPGDLTLLADGLAHMRHVGTTGADNLVASHYGDTLLGGRGGDTLVGGNGADSIDGSLDNDVLTGGRGNDTLVGGAGADTMTGGTGPDLFILLGPHARSGIGRDVITDFNGAEGDTIDLSAIDANDGLDGDQSFMFIGAAAFTDLGQLRYANGLLQGNFTGNARADIEIALTGTPDIAAGWILL